MNVSIFICMMFYVMVSQYYAHDVYVCMILRYENASAMLWYDCNLLMNDFMNMNVKWWMVQFMNAHECFDYDVCFVFLWFSDANMYEKCMWWCFCECQNVLSHFIQKDMKHLILCQLLGKSINVKCRF